VKDPKVFMFDEPLSNLDAALRSRTRQEIANLHRRIKRTMVFVTHDQTEAMTLAHRIVIMNRQRIEQVGTPSEIYSHPATLFVASFVGSPAMNILPVDDAVAAARHGCTCEARRRYRSSDTGVPASITCE
jgi:multiple sugar transport system ATP-binding protein